MERRRTWNPSGRESALSGSANGRLRPLVVSVAAHWYRWRLKAGTSTSPGSAAVASCTCGAAAATATTTAARRAVHRMAAFREAYGSGSGVLQAGEGRSAARGASPPAHSGLCTAAAMFIRSFRSCGKRMCDQNDERLVAPLPPPPLLQRPSRGSAGAAASRLHASLASVPAVKAAGTRGRTKQVHRVVILACPDATIMGRKRPQSRAPSAPSRHGRRPGPAGFPLMACKAFEQLISAARYIVTASFSLLIDSRGLYCQQGRARQR